jgi:NAD(P)-dependent dehydrogenase (short-subunit alcohol dehydrogenase family)
MSIFLKLNRSIRNNQKPMDGKICMVTGSTTGIGAAIALEMARQRATVVVVGRYSNKCNGVVQRIRRISKNC